MEDGFAGSEPSEEILAKLIFYGLLSALR